jgi:chaperone required for assembly of F1-ATPase
MAANDNEPPRADAKPKVLGREALQPPLPRRFYKDATAEPREGAFAILLDGRPARTPGKRPLAFASRALAELIAAEWAAQDTVIDPSRMPVTRIVNSGIDAVADRMGDVRADITAYAGSDLLCYRADHPRELVQRQAAAWDPVLAWARDDRGIHLVLAEGVMPVAQSPVALARVSAELEDFDPLSLAATHVMTTLSGSAVLALAVARGRLTAAEAWTAAHVDEDWQISQWGEDAEAADRRRRRWMDMDAAARIVTVLAG